MGAVVRVVGRQVHGGALVAVCPAPRPHWALSRLPSQCPASIVRARELSDPKHSEACGSTVQRCLRTADGLRRFPVSVNYGSTVQANSLGLGSLGRHLFPWRRSLSVTFSEQFTFIFRHIQAFVEWAGQLRTETLRTARKTWLVSSRTGSQASQLQARPFLYRTGCLPKGRLWFCLVSPEPTECRKAPRAGHGLEPQAQNC